MLRFLINLKDSKERLSRMQDILGRLDIDFERIEAVNGKAMDPAKVLEIQYPLNDLYYRTRFTRLLSPGEVGCYLSHIACWKRLVNSNEQWALIMEDDIIVSSLAGQYMKSCDWIPPQVDVCQLSMLNHKKNKDFIVGFERLKVDDRLTLVQPKYPLPVGAHAYLISRKAAQEAIRQSSKLASPVDIFLFSPWFDFGQTFKTWRVNPVLVLPNDAIESDIWKGTARKVEKAPFWIRKHPKRMIMDYRIRKEQRKGAHFDFEFVP